MTLTAPQLRGHLYRGANASQIAAHYGITREAVESRKRHFGLSRWDVKLVLCTELAAQHGVTTTAVRYTAARLGVTPRPFGPFLMYTPRDAARIAAVYAEVSDPADLPDWLPRAAVCARLGVKPQTLSSAIHGQRPWAMLLDRRKVRVKRGWAWAYSPESVDAAHQARRSLRRSGRGRMVNP